jgi:Ras GTPase-activating protein 3
MSDILREAMLTKRAQGFTKGGPKNWKVRFFRLTRQELSYWEKDIRSSSDAKKKGQIPVTDILAVEDVRDNCFDRQNLFQVVYNTAIGSMILYVQCDNAADRNAWVAALQGIMSPSKRNQHYHPAYFDGKAWLCCRHESQDLEGCQPTTMYASTRSDLTFQKTSGCGPRYINDIRCEAR